MKNIKVIRKKKFAGAVMPYWIIAHKAKTDFKAEFGLEGDACNMSMAGFPVSRIDMHILDSIGTRIRNGQTIELELEDEVKTIFASTMDGYLSNEINVDEYIASGKQVVINTKGGFKNIPHPVIEG